VLFLFECFLASGGDSEQENRRAVDRSGRPLLYFAFGKMRVAGLEPARPFGQRILSPLRLPIPPHPLSSSFLREISSFVPLSPMFPACSTIPDSLHQVARFG
jgi:hypothetical protein